MKALTFLLIITSFYLSAFSQEKRDGIKLMIDSAIRLSYNRVRIEANHGQGNPNYLQNIYLLDSSYRPLQSVDDSIKKWFKFIMVYDKHNLKIVKKGITLWKVSFKLNQKIFAVRIDDVYFKYKKGKYFAYYGQWSDTTFEYDCASDIWKLTSFKSAGI